MASPTQKKDINNFDAIAISVASPEQILSWSHGEVKKPETINYRTQKPERDGLFCERIFGPTKNYECYCGKYKRIRYKGVICEKCGVEVTHSSVRRERMGHIKLAVPTTHIWYLRSTPSRIGLLLDLPIKTIEQVVYFAAYIITEANIEAKNEAIEQLTTEFKQFKKKLVDEEKEKHAELKAKLSGQTLEKAKEDVTSEYAQKAEELTEQHNSAKSDLKSIEVGTVINELEYRDLSLKFGHVFKASTGAASIRDIIENMDLEGMLADLTGQQKRLSGQKLKKTIKRIKLIGSLLKGKIKPEWMVLNILPVIPPDIRPMVQLDGGRFAASDLNDLYRRVINRNNRLKKLLSIGAPEVICRNEKRMLQEAVDTLLNNSARQSRAAFTAGSKRKLRSLSDMLKGKQGRFRQNLLGKRVDYSGRSVIVIGPSLKLNQCGLPKEMALELFKPFVIGRLIRDGYAHNIKSAEKLISANRREVWDILEEETRDRHVLLNRAPTLHRLGIQAFKPVLIEGKAIQVHPLVCAAFNADFDGDQMAVHVPLSDQAQKEAGEIIVSNHNLLKPSAGEPITTPTQDIVLGCYYLTKITPGEKGENMIFGNPKEAIASNQLGHLHLQAPIRVRINNEIIETTAGRLIFNEVIPEKLGFVNKTFNKKALSNLVDEALNLYEDHDILTRFLDDLKKMGFYYATRSGLSISASDMIIPDNKEEAIDLADEEVKKINNFFWQGLITDNERYLHTIRIWSETKNDISNQMISCYEESNDIHHIVNSGARGNWGQVTQMSGMKGLVANPAGKTIELPIKASLKEGFSILEYFIATHGGRKGKSDTALKTAEAGYLTRRLVDAVQDIVIREIDCGSKEPHTITVAESQQIGEDFDKRIFGRVMADALVDPKTGEVLIEANHDIGRGEIKAIEDANITEVKVRSVITCKTKGGICKKCYGRDLGTNKEVEIGTAVGIIAAQSIGEPGTQLTMRTFHMGGIAQESDITQGLTRVEELFEARTPKSPAIVSEIPGKVTINHKGQVTKVSITSVEPIDTTYIIPELFEATVSVGDTIKERQAMAKSTTSNRSLRSKEAGVVKAIIDNEIILESDGNVTQEYTIPPRKTLRVVNGDLVGIGTPLTSGHLDLREFMKLTSFYDVQKYIVQEVQSIYASQGQTINDKHIEIIARQMLSTCRVLESGDSSYLPGEIIDIITLNRENQELIDDGKKIIRAERLLLGLTRTSLYTESWLSAASFQETIRVLVEASTTKKVDQLKGLKENVIIGKLIPAGKTYREW